MGIDSAKLKELGNDKVSEQFEPFKSTSVKCIKRGDLKATKIKSLVMEVIGIEVVGNCY